MRTWWITCGRCAKTFDVGESRDDGAWTMHRRLTDTHRRVAPACEGGRLDFRVHAADTESN